jgi:preprotein translocase subunit SecF
VWGLNIGIDFTGGSLIEVKFSQTVPELGNIQNSLTPENLGTINLQPGEDNTLLLRLRSLSTDEHIKLLEDLKTSFPDQQIEELRYETIGPIIGSELKRKASYAISVSLIFIISYIAYSFRKVSYPVKSWKYGVTAILAMMHDLIIVCGVFSLLGRFFSYEVNILFITALLTTLGYSINDTIVVFDRTRENLNKNKNENFAVIVNNALNQTLTRSINTGFNTILVLISIFIFGGDSMKEFVLALILGFSVGTFSSIALASPLLVDWNLWSSKKVK